MFWRGNVTRPFTSVLVGAGKRNLLHPRKPYAKHRGFGAAVPTKSRPPCTIPGCINPSHGHQDVDVSKWGCQTPACADASHYHDKNTVFFRRPLPDTCIDLASDTGQYRFASAMASQGTACFFHLVSQFRTQEEPAYCGISTLVMCLNALEVDPGRVWKGVWRWWVEEMLDDLKPMDDVKEEGINFDEFVCLAKMKLLSVNATRAPRMDLRRNDGPNTLDSMAQFRDTVRNVTAGNGKVLLVCSYDRATLGQTGSGHFSPIGAYDEETDSILVLDVARFKYPPHWVQLPLLYEAMRKIDTTTGETRGWVTLTLAEGPAAEPAESGL